MDERADNALEFGHASCLASAFPRIWRTKFSFLLRRLDGDAEGKTGSIGSRTKKDKVGPKPGLKREKSEVHNTFCRDR